MLVEQAIEHLDDHGEEADLLRAIARFVSRTGPLNGAATAIGVYPGTFDPITLGHLDIIRRGAHLVDRLVIGVTTNPSKEPMFSVAERLAMVQREVADIAGDIAVVEFDSLLMDFAEREGAIADPARAARGRRLRI